ncbi:ABC transporter substrate-binding protein [Variovorax sp. VNK109]|uniref:ABC transporter substrate-binding protein n=1 Tax=Variovorax sp. VNK109 TaxID=3400919 RepID=UPI003C06DF3E
MIANSIKRALGVLASLPIIASAQAVQGVTPTEILLGMHADLSGPAASFGVPVANAFRMRIDEENAKGGIHGRKIRLIVEDSQYQVPRAVQAANKLISHDKVFAFVGAAGTPMNNAALPLQQKAGIPNLFPITWASSMSEPVNPLKYAIYQPYQEQIKSGLSYMIGKKGKKAVCAMYQDTDFGRDVFDGVQAYLKSANLPLVASASHRATEQDFTAAISKLRDAKCDLIALGTIVRDTIVPYSTARKMGWNDVDFIGAASSYDLTVSGAQGGATEGLYATGFFDPPYRDTANPAVARWFDAYKARFNADPAIQAAVGQVIMDLTIRALHDAGKDLNTQTLATAFERINGYQDMFNGPLQSITPTSHASARSSIIYVVKDGRWTRVSESSGQK